MTYVNRPCSYFHDVASQLSLHFQPASNQSNRHPIKTTGDASLFALVASMQALASSNPGLFGWLISHMLSVSDISIAECLGKLMRTCKAIHRTVMEGEALHLPYCFALQSRRCWEGIFDDKKQLPLGHPTLDYLTVNPHSVEACCTMANQGLLADYDMPSKGDSGPERCWFCKDGTQPRMWWIHCAAYRCCRRYPVMYATFEQAMTELVKDVREGFYWLQQRPRISHPRGPDLRSLPLKRGLDDKSICKLCWKNKKMKETRHACGLIDLCSACNRERGWDTTPPFGALAKRRRLVLPSPF
jgi:hypothetical protein